MVALPPLPGLMIKAEAKFINYIQDLLKTGQKEILEGYFDYLCEELDRVSVSSQNQSNLLALGCFAVAIVSEAEPAV